MKTKHKIMVIDVGNTNITVGVFHGDEILTTFRLMTQEANTSRRSGRFFAQTRLPVPKLRA